MRTASVERAVCVQDHKPPSKMVLMGYAVSGDEVINFKVKYDFSTMDQKGFVEDLRDSLAKGFDVAPTMVDLQEGRLLRLMSGMQNEFESKVIH